MRNQTNTRPVNTSHAPACILCDADRFHTILVTNGWHYLECRQCGLVTLHPQPTPKDLRANYNDYLPADEMAIRQWRALVKPVIDVSAVLITTRLGHTGRLLDVGCGYGFFMERMQQSGWLVEGIEVSPIGRQYALRQGRFEVHAHPLEDLALDENRYDAVTLFYVIEHVSDPINVLKQVKKVLKPGGLVLLRWPHSTPIVKLLGPWAHHLDVYHTPYHLFDFSPANMTRLLKQAGFSRIETMIGGHTHPANRLGRGVTVAFGHLAQVLFTISHGRWLLPGVSKTTLARG